MRNTSFTARQNGSFPSFNQLQNLYTQANQNKLDVDSQVKYIECLLEHKRSDAVTFIANIQQVDLFHLDANWLNAAQLSLEALPAAEASKYATFHLFILNTVLCECFGRKSFKEACLLVRHMDYILSKHCDVVQQCGSGVFQEFQAWSHLHFATLVARYINEHSSSQWDLNVPAMPLIQHCLRACLSVMTFDSAQVAESVRGNLLRMSSSSAHNIDVAIAQDLLPRFSALRCSQAAHWLRHVEAVSGNPPTSIAFSPLALRNAMSQFLRCQSLISTEKDNGSEEQETIFTGNVALAGARPLNISDAQLLKWDISCLSGNSLDLVHLTWTMRQWSAVDSEGDWGLSENGILILDKVVQKHFPKLRCIAFGRTDLQDLSSPESFNRFDVVVFLLASSAYTLWNSPEPEEFLPLSMCKHRNTYCAPAVQQKNLWKAMMDIVAGRSGGDLGRIRGTLRNGLSQLRLREVLTPDQVPVLVTVARVLTRYLKQFNTNDSMTGDYPGTLLALGNEATTADLLKEWLHVYWNSICDLLRSAITFRSRPGDHLPSSREHVFLFTLPQLPPQHLQRRWAEEAADWQTFGFRKPLTSLKDRSNNDVADTSTMSSSQVQFRPSPMKNGASGQTQEEEVLHSLPIHEELVTQLMEANHHLHTRMMDAAYEVHSRMMDANQNLHTRIMEANHSLHTNIVSTNQSLQARLMDLQTQMEKMHLNYANLADEVKLLRQQSEGTAQLVKNQATNNSQAMESEISRALLLATSQQQQNALLQQQMAAMWGLHLNPTLLAAASYNTGFVPPASRATTGPVSSGVTVDMGHPLTTAVPKPPVSVETPRPLGGFGTPGGTALLQPPVPTFETPVVAPPRQPSTTQITTMAATKPTGLTTFGGFPSESRAAAAALPPVSTVMSKPGAPTSVPAQKGSTPAVQPESNANFMAKFQPKPGSWSCTGCYINNAADVRQCPACNTKKPGESTAPAVKPATHTTEKTAPKPATAAASASLMEKFKPKPGSWMCTGCYLSHDGDVKQCPACNTLKPGETAPPPASSQATESTFGGLFGSKPSTSTGTTAPDSTFKFGSAAVTSTQAPSTSNFAGLFGATSTPSVSGGGTFKFGSTPASTVTPSTHSGSMSVFPPSADNTFKFGGTSLVTSMPATSSVFSLTNSATVSTAAGNNSGGTSHFQFSTAKPPTTAQSSPFAGFGSSLTTKPVQTTAAATTTTTSASTSLFSFTTPSDNKGGSLFGNLNLQGSTTEKPAFSGLFGNPAASSSFSFSTKPATEPRPHNTSVGEESDEIVPEEEGEHIYFKPVLEELPEKVEVNTGEEEDETLFCERARLYRWCPPSNGTTEGGEWKERGIGDMKLLRHKTSQQTRVVMRREQVLKVCCNHRITSSMQLRPMAGGNDRAWTWIAQDFAESLDTPELLTLAVKFRDEQTARRFQEEFMKAAGAQRTPEKSLLQRSNGDATPKTSDSQTPASTQAPLSSAVQNGPSKKEDADTKISVDLDARKDSVSSKASDGSDVIFVKEERRMVTEEQKARARALMLPETYFAFENEPGYTKSDDEGSTDDKKNPEPPAASTTSSAPRNQGLFLGGNSAFLDFSSLAQGAAGKSSFGGFQHSGDAAFSWSSMKGQVFGGFSQKPHDTSDGDAGHDEAANENYDPQYEPVISLPELVPRQTGEEDDECLFEKRARLYRFADGQWKERGTGILKVLVRKGDKPGELDYRKARLLMRREQILKLCCNHAISESCPKFTPFANSGANAACWTAQDFSEGGAKTENLAVKFKTDAEMEQFQKVVANIQDRLKSGSS